MYGICRDVSVLAVESYFDNYKIVNVFQVVPDCIFIDFRIAILNYQISCSSNTYFVCNMAR